MYSFIKAVESLYKMKIPSTFLYIKDKGIPLYSKFYCNYSVSDELIPCVQVFVCWSKKHT